MRAALVSGRDRRAEIGEPSCKRASTTPAATSPAPPVIFPAAAKDLSPNGFKAVVDIDLLGTFHVMRAAYPHMRRAGGSIIDISAPQATIPMAMQIHVCASKAGLDMVTRCLAIEWAPEGVRVNGVVPGPRLAPTEAMRAAITASVPMRRFGSPQDVADACLWLGSAAAYVSGTIIFADGGWAQRGAPIG